MQGRKNLRRIRILLELSASASRIVRALRNDKLTLTESLRQIGSLLRIPKRTKHNERAKPSEQREEEKEEKASEEEVESLLSEYDIQSIDDLEEKRDEIPFEEYNQIIKYLLE